MKYKGSCHCGQVAFEVEGEFVEGLICNCSICHRKGTVLGFVPETKFTLLKGELQLTDYQFGPKRIHHTFCSTCGVTAFSSAKSPSGEQMKAINLRCIEDLDFEGIKINSYDGRSI